MNYAELKQKKEAMKAERDRLESQIAALKDQEYAAEQEFLAGLAVVKVSDRLAEFQDRLKVVVAFLLDFGV